MQKSDSKFLVSVAPLTRIGLNRDQSFFYTHHSKLTIGALVSISIGRRHVEGVVTGCSPDFPRESNFEIKKITKVLEKDFLTKEQLNLAEFISSYYLSSLGITLKYFVPKRVKMRGSFAYKKTRLKKILINDAQKKLINKFFDDTKKTSSKVFENYFFHITDPAEKITVLFSIINKIRAKSDAQVLYLLPELIQTPYLKAFVYHFFPANEIAVLHSKLGKGELYKHWRDIKSGKIKIIIGTRSALFAPFKNLELIIIDEAHDMSHKQWEHYPLFDARTASIELAKQFHCPHISTSAAPRGVDYFHKNNKTNTKFLSIIGNKPSIDLVDMKKERWDKNKSPLSRALVSQIRRAIRKNKQVLIFVNRQGTSAFSICSKCRNVAKCPTCERALVSTKQNNYICIHCNFIEKTKPKCSHCKSPIEHIGIGTDKIQKELSKIFPKAHIRIADSSTMKKSGAHSKLFRDFSDKKIDIVIGTQMITKNWSNDVAVAAIIDMDHLLSLPEYSVNEKAFAFIIQMAGRTNKGRLIIQTFQPENPVVQHATNYKFDDFYEDELSLRKVLSYPPYTKLIKLFYQDTSKSNTEKNVDDLHEKLISLLKNNKNVIISEPHFPVVDKIRTKYRKQIIIKIKNESIPNELEALLIAQNTNWIVDIDPITIA